MNPLSSTEFSHLWQLSHIALPFSFELSSYFMSVFYKNISHEVALSEIQNTVACLSCGTIWIPGWTCSVRLRRSSKKRYKRQMKTKQTLPQIDYWVEYQCQRCGRITKFQRKKWIESKDEDVSVLPSSPSHVSKNSSIRSEKNAASRRRKKLRLGGLQGILDKMAQAEKKENELSLEDFMYQT